MNKQLKKLTEKILTQLMKLNIKDLMDYTLESTIGCDIRDFYQEILEELFNEEVIVSGIEISDGKYLLTIKIGDAEYHLYSKGSYTKEEVNDLIIVSVVIPFLKRGGVI